MCCDGGATMKPFSSARASATRNATRNSRAVTDRGRAYDRRIRDNEPCRRAFRVAVQPFDHDQQRNVATFVELPFFAHLEALNRRRQTD